MKLKLFLFAILCLLNTFSSLSQSVKEYFIPSEDKNQSLYYTPNPNTGLKTGNEEFKYFSRKSDFLIVLTVNLFNGQINSATEERVKIINNEVLLISTKSGSILTNDSKEKNYNPPHPLLKVPKSNADNQSWSYINGSETTMCTAVFTDLNIEGEKRKSILVLKNVYDKGKYVEWASTKEYYVAGIGLYKVLTAKDEVYMILDKQTFDPNPPISK